MLIYMFFSDPLVNSVDMWFDFSFVPNLWSIGVSILSIFVLSCLITVGT